MKRLIALSIVIALALSGCAQPKTIDGVTYGPYGLFNESEMYNKDIEYRVSWGNVVLGALFLDTIIAPIYTFGFAMWEPVGKQGATVKGQIR